MPGQNLHGRESELEVQRGACDPAPFIPGLPQKAETYFSAKHMEETPAPQVHQPGAAGLWVSCPEEHTWGAQAVPQRPDGVFHLAKDYSR